MKTLHRSSRHKIFLGVCGGLAEYFGVDPVAIRIVMALLGLMGAGILFYFAAFFIMPPDTTAEGMSASDQPKQSSTSNITIIIGGVLIFFGLCFLLDNFHVVRFHELLRMMRNVLIPCLVIAIGIGILLRRKKKQNAAEVRLDVPLEQAPLRAGQWYRSRQNRKVLGVCAGIAHAMELDPTVVRLAWVVLTITSVGLGLFLYIILALILPEEPLPT
ncbi:MAG TPA: PspC domain-containing protein [Candidatus Kapabacteria bacterium]|nr:PspC domain-containing protein [Candidatus Kapabacteria bacterium]